MEVKAKYNKDNIDTLKQPTNLTLRVNFGDTTKEYVSLYLYNISDYFKIVIDKGEIPTFDKDCKNLIYLLSLNIDFMIPDEHIKLFVTFADYINCSYLFPMIYNYILNTYRSKDINFILSLLFNHISQKEKLELYNKLDDYSLFSNISQTDLKYLILNCDYLSKNNFVDIIVDKKMNFTENEIQIIRSKELEKTIKYRLLLESHNIFLEAKYEDYISYTHIDTANNNLYAYNGNFGIIENFNPLPISKLTETGYSNIFRTLFKSHNLYLVPIIKKCIQDQQIIIKN